MAETIDVGSISEQKAAYEAALPRAQKLEAGTLRGFQGDSLVILQNAEIGHKNVQAQRAKIANRFTPEELSLLDKTLETALALRFADMQLRQLLSLPTVGTSPKIARCYEVRRILLFGAQSCLEADLLTHEEELRLEKIIEGTGAADAAEDCIALAALYEGSKALQQNTPAHTKPELLQEASTLGTTLSRELNVEGVLKEKQTPERVEEAKLARDQLYTLLQNGHELLVQAGGFLFGLKDAYKFVPKLLSQKRARKPQNAETTSTQETPK
jgi:hypothetical protein